MDKFSDETTCIICFRKQDTVFSLFCKQKGISPWEKLNKIGLKSNINDTGPCCICCDCLTELETTIKFIEKCEKANQILAEHFSREVELTEEIVTCKDNSNINLENNGFYCENRAVETIQDAPVESNISDEVKASEILVEDEQCGVCKSRRRCRHWSPPATHTCPYCQKVFNRKYNYKLHLKRHNKEREWMCARCGASAVTRWLAVRHCAPRPRRLCPVPGCGKTYTTNTNLSTHLTTHSGERPFECNDCGKKFASKNTMQNHIRIHTGALPYICPICGKRFRTNKLSAHMRTHSGARHACARPDCAQRFGSRPAVLRHMRAHAHYPAGTDGATVGARTAAPQHPCSFCPTKYHHRQSLNKHVRKQHAQITVPAKGQQLT